MKVGKDTILLTNQKQTDRAKQQIYKSSSSTELRNQKAKAECQAILHNPRK